MGGGSIAGHKMATNGGDDASPHKKRRNVNIVKEKKEQNLHNNNFYEFPMGPLNAGPFLLV